MLRYTNITLISTGKSRIHFLTHFRALFGLLQWSGTQAATSLRYACILFKYLLCNKQWATLPHRWANQETGWKTWNIWTNHRALQFQHYGAICDGDVISAPVWEALRKHRDQYSSAPYKNTGEPLSRPSPLHIVPGCMKMNNSQSLTLRNSMIQRNVLRSQMFLVALARTTQGATGTL